MKDIKSMVPAIKDCAVFAGWLAAIFLVAFLCWLLTGPIRGEYLMRAVNRNDLLSIPGRERPYLENSIPAGEVPGRTGRIGSWFTIRDRAGSRALVFTLFAQGSFFPCMALVNPEGKVEEILPLSVHAESMLKSIPAGVIRLHIRRIEGVEQ